MQKAGDERFDTAAILQNDFLLGFCIWVMPWQVVKVKGVVGVGTSFDLL
jgi:hypothetical protein